MPVNLQGRGTDRYCGKVVAGNLPGFCRRLTMRALRLLLLRSVRLRFR